MITRIYKCHLEESLIQVACLTPIALFYGILYLKERSNLLAIATGTTFSLLLFPLGNLLISFFFTPYANITLAKWVILGVTHIYLGYLIQGGRHQFLTPFLYCFGIFEFLSGLFFIDFPFYESIGWDFVMLLGTLTTFFFGHRLRFKPFYIFSYIYTMALVIRIGLTHFHENATWPILLFGTGALILISSYFTPKSKGHK